MAAEKLGAVLNIRFPNEAKPKIVMTDKGRGFYHGFTSGITAPYKAGLRSSGLRAFMGDDAKEQPGDLQDMMLHETAVAWIRHRESTSRPATPWTETVTEFGARLRSICQDINQNCDVEGLCRKLPERAQAVADAEGGRIKA